MRKLIITLFILSVLILAGCAEKECKVRSDCESRGSCFLYTCVKGECVEREKANCNCGNAVCDEDLGENSCTCVDDCGTCEEEVSDFMEKTCVNDQCITQIKGLEEKSAEDVIKYEESRQVKLQLSLKATYSDPFNVKQSLMNINLKIDKIMDDVNNVKITKIKIIEHTGSKNRYGGWDDDEPVTLSEKTYTKTLFDQTSTFNKEFPIFIEGIDPEASEQKTITLEISYELKTKDRYGNPVSNEGLFEKEMSMTFVSPDAPVVCPDCEDNNDCTKGTCNAGTNFFCEYEIISSGSCCGDDICSPNEDKCRCSTDCGKCTGDVGEYMRMGCSSLNMCTFQIKNVNLIQPTSKLTDVEFGNAKMSMKVNYDIPFDKSSSLIAFTFEPKVFSNVKNLVLKKIILLDDSGTILGEASGNIAISEGSSSSASAAISYKSLNAEEEKTVTVRFEYSLKEYDSRADEWNDVVSSYSYSLGKLTLLNPS